MRFVMLVAVMVYMLDTNGSLLKQCQDKCQLCYDSCKLTHSSFPFIHSFTSWTSDSSSN